MRTALKAKNKLVFIDGSPTKPTVMDDNASELQARETSNSLVSSSMLNVIEPKLRTGVAYNDTPKAMCTTKNVLFNDHV